MKKLLLPKKTKIGLISVTKAAEILGVSPDTLRNWDEQGRLRVRRTKGGARRYSLKQLQALKKEIHPAKKRIGLLSVTKAAKELKVSADTLRSWDKKGFIIGSRTNGGARRFTRAEVNRVKKELGVVEKIEEKAEDDLKLKLVEQSAPIIEAKVSKTEPKVRVKKFPVFRFLSMIALLLALFDIGVLASFSKFISKDLVSQANFAKFTQGYQKDLAKLMKTLENAQSSLSDVQSKQIADESDILLIKDQNYRLDNPDNIKLYTQKVSSLNSTSANSGLQIDSDGLSLLRGCSNNQVLSWNNSDLLWNCKSVTDIGGGDINKVGSMGSGDAFADSSADGNWLGLGSDDGRIEFHDKDTDQISLMKADVGINTSSPNYLLEVFGSTNLDPTFALSSANVSHGMSAIASDNVFGLFKPISNSDGGLKLETFSDTDASAFNLFGYIGSADPADVTPAIKLIGGKKDGSGIQGLGANETVFQVSNYNSDPAIALLGSGNLGIGTITPEARVQITGGGLCVGSDVNCNSDNNTEGVIYASSTTTTVYDLAENYPTKDLSLSAGEVVELDSSNQVFVKRSELDNAKLLGVISTKPGVLLGGFNGDQFKDDHQVPVALSGRVLVKIATDSDNIEVGDFLTSSNQAGKATKATKAGFMIGRALESWRSADQKKSILVFVSSTYADPQNLLANLTFDNQGRVIDYNLSSSLNLGGIDDTKVSFAHDSLNFQKSANPIEIAASVEKLQSDTLNLEVKQAQTEKELASLSDKISQVEESLSKKLIAADSSQPESTASAVADIPIYRSADKLDLAPPDILAASSSASLADLKISQTLSSDNLVNALNLTVSGVFKALGDVSLATTTIAGDLTVDGTFSVSQNAINALPTLYLQNSALAESIDLFNGKVTINKLGDIKAHSVIVADFKVVSGHISGSGTVKSGQKTVFVENSLVDQDSRILITPTTETIMVLAVTKKEDNKGFWVSSPEVLKQNLDFDWWMVREEKDN